MRGCRFWAAVVVALCCVGHVLAAPKFGCSVETIATASTGRRRGRSGVISFVGDSCEQGQVSVGAVLSSGGTVTTGPVTTSGKIRPFRVAGGDEEEEEIETAVPVDRPDGKWKVVVETEVKVPVHEAWFTMKNFGNVLVYGLSSFGAEVRSFNAKGKKWVVDLLNGESATFAVIATNNEKYYHTVKIESHTSLVFPGVKVVDSLIFIQFVYKSESKTMIEMGWDGKVRGPLDVAVTVIGALFQGMLESLEKKFGDSCKDVKSIRTIEGDCNNLGDPKRGAAGHALVRLGGADPSFPNGDPSHPTGPVHISPRLISNRLCAQSPGAAILEANAEKMRGMCVSTTVEGATWRICPYVSATRTESTSDDLTLEWNGYTTYDDGSFEMQFAGEECVLELALACHGVASVELVADPCGRKGNVLFHPVGCKIRPGEDEVLMSSKDLTDLFWTFGQFVDHDLDLTPVTQIAKKKQPGFSKNSRSNAEELPISVPENDFFIKEKEMEFERTTLIKDRRLGLHENQHSAYADLGQVYGVDYLRARALRTFKGGKLKVSSGNLPPFNKINGPGALRAKVDNAPDAEDKFFAVGDIRGNEQTLLLVMHIIWMREHNLICDELAAAFPEWSDERLYQTARAIAIAEYQSIIYDEWLPLLLGEGVCPSNAYFYDATIDPSITAIFSTAAFRFGHTMVGSYLWKLGSGPRETATLERVPLRKLFFKPEVVQNERIEDYLRGAAWHHCKEVDVKVVDELRNFLFTKNERKGHMDLVSLNLQRGRDMGLPSFVQMRELVGLPPYSSFYDFIEDEHLATESESVYEDVSQCDALYGGFAEAPFPGSLVGETFHVIIKDQFTKIRDADRFFFKGLQWDPEIVAAYPRILGIMGGSVKLRDVIVRNCGVTDRELGHREAGTIMKL